MIDAKNDKIQKCFELSTPSCLLLIKISTGFSYLFFTSDSFIGDVATDFLAFGFMGVASNKLAPVLVQAVTIGTGE